MFNKNILLLLALLSWCQLVWSHPPGLSSAEISIGQTQTLAILTFAIQDIEAFTPMDNDQDAEVTPTEMEAAKPAIANWVATQLVLSLDNTPLQPTAAGSVSFDDQNNAQVQLPFAGAVGQQLTLQARVLSKLPPGHKQYVTVKQQAGGVLLEKMLTQHDDTLQLNLTAQSTGNPSVTQSSIFSDFLKLGVEHILTGYDHLLFLFSLLVVTRSFWPALKIITCFTLAHSITLGLASFNVFELPGSIVEPLIAITIIYVALENLWRGDNPKGREWLTFFFGLIHGFGFASVLREMNIADSDGGIVLPLFSFNLGVELGQITVASLILPLIWWLYKSPVLARKLAPVGSVIAGLAGVFWLVQRTLFS